MPTTMSLASVKPTTAVGAPVGAGLVDARPDAKVKASKSKDKAASAAISPSVQVGDWWNGSAKDVTDVTSKFTGDAIASLNNQYAFKGGYSGSGDAYNLDYGYYPWADSGLSGWDSFVTKQMPTGIGSGGSGASKPTYSVDQSGLKNYLKQNGYRIVEGKVSDSQGARWVVDKDGNAVGKPSYFTTGTKAALAQFGTFAAMMAPVAAGIAAAGAGAASAAGGAGTAGGAAGGATAAEGAAAAGSGLGASGGGLSVNLGTATGLGSTGLGAGSAVTAGEALGAAGGAGLTAGGAAAGTATGLASTGLGAGAAVGVGESMGAAGGSGLTAGTTGSTAATSLGNTGLGAAGNVLDSTGFNPEGITNPNFGKGADFANVSAANGGGASSMGWGDWLQLGNLALGVYKTNQAGKLAGESLDAAKLNAETQKAISDRQMALAEKQYADQTALWNELKPYYMQQIQTQLGEQQKSIGRADSAWADYQNIWRPQEQRLSDMTTELTAPGRTEQEAQRAAADVTSQADAAAQENRRQLEAAGASPEKIAALEAAGRLSTAKAVGGAMGDARRAQETRAIGLVDNAARFGRNQTSTGLSLASLGTNQGGAVTGTAGATQGAASVPAGTTSSILGQAANTNASAGNLWLGMANAGTNQQRNVMDFYGDLIGAGAGLLGMKGN